jgi:hypothetical protein
MQRFLGVFIICCLGISLAKAQVRPAQVLEAAPSIKQTLLVSNNASLRITAANLYHTEKSILSSSPSEDFDVEIKLNNTQTKVVTKYTIADSLVLPNSFSPTYIKGVEKKQLIVLINIPRFIKASNGTITELISYEVQVIKGAPIKKKTRGQRSYAANSVLANGDVYKLAVNSAGVHKISYSLLKDGLKIDPASINPAYIKLYGNGGGMVPENNAIPRLDDVAENALYAVGLDDGVFNTTDYLLFYSNGPHAIVPDTLNLEYTHLFNIYSDNTFYFLTIGTTPGLRVPTIPSASGANTTITTFNDYVFWEKDSINVGDVFEAVAFGKRWWGESFGSKFGQTLVRNYNHIFPNLITTQPVKVKSIVGSRSKIASSSFQFTANGTNIFNSYLSATGDSYDLPIVRPSYAQASYTSATDAINIKLTYTPNDDFGLGLLDFLSINANRKLQWPAGASQMRFANFSAKGAGNIANYIVENANSNLVIWDVTAPTAIKQINNTLSGTTLNFAQEASSFKQYIAVNPSANFTEPVAVGKIANQNLHNTLSKVDYLIICNPSFINQANALAAHHTYKRNLKVVVATTDEIYNEFGSGAKDISAVRDFIKMYYDKAATAADAPKNVLFFGDASFDYRGRNGSNTDFVPTRESDESELKIDTYCSDDFFGMLDDNENINDQSIYNPLDIGIGRFVCNTAEEANTLVQKVKIYDSSASFGSWRQNLTFCADNKDGAVHANDAELMSSIVASKMPSANNYKLYIDAFPIYPTPGGERAPAAKQNLDAQLYNGTLAVNYNGHGGIDAWCDERIFHTSDIPNYTNLYKLPLFITATCDFGPYTNPDKVSAGEKIVLFNKGGAIANITTTQLVFQYENQRINADFWRNAFNKDNGRPVSIGESVSMAKNATYSAQKGSLSNYRKFVLLGDPALTLAVPKYDMQLDSVNGKSVNIGLDTISALDVCFFSGSVVDANGALLSNFNGTADITLFDKVKNLKTLGQHPASPVLDYDLQNDVVFKGKATVSNGKWRIKFIVPKDINYTYGAGKLSMYASSNIADAGGYSNKVVIGGVGSNNTSDNAGPIVRPFINDTTFINGGITGENASLIVLLSDDNGINTSSGSIGHDITAVLDGNDAEPIILNNFYEGATDDYTRGIVKYPLKNLAPGQHTLKVKAWDVLNNSNEATVDFVVNKRDNASIGRVFNYPNPFTTRTNFTFEHNFPGETLYVTIHIFSVNGTLVKQIRKVVNTESSRVTDIEWDGLDETGDPIGRGVYLYKVYFKTQSGKFAAKYEKLVKL